MGLYLKVLRFGEEVLVNDLSVIIDMAGGTIGRAQGNDLVLPDTEEPSSISRIHVKIESEGGKFFVIDCSSNGTTLLEPVLEEDEGGFNEIFLHGEKKEIRVDGYIVIGDFEILAQYHEPSEQYFPSQGLHTPVSSSIEKNLPTERHVANVGQGSSKPTPVLQSSISIPEAKKELAVDEIPEIFNIDDFINEGTIPLEKDSEESLLAGLQNPEGDKEEAYKQSVISIDVMSQPVPLVIDEDSTNGNFPLPKNDENRDTPQEAYKAHSIEIRRQVVVESNNKSIFFESLGVNIERLPKDEKELDQLMSDTGKMLRFLLESNMALLKARADIKREISSSMTIVQKEENNPLKLCQSVDEALSQLFFEKKPGFLSGPDAVNESCHDLQTHQMAMMSGIQSALNGAVRLFDPVVVENNSDTGRFNKGAKYWDYYVSQYKTISDSARADFFGADFSAAYEQQVRAMKKPK